MGDPTFWNSISSAGDVNADGFAEVIIGAPGDLRVRPGNAFVYGGHSVPLGHVVGTVLAGGSPLANVTIDLVQMGDAPEESRPLGFVTTDATGAFAAMNLPTAQIEVSVAIPLGYEAVTPTGGATVVTISENQTTIQDFSLAVVPDAGPARSMGYWKHQVNVHMLGRGNAQESYEAMSLTYPGLIYDHFYMNSLNSIRLFGITYEGEAALTLERMQSTFNDWMLNCPSWQHPQNLGAPGVNAARQLLAVFLNVASNRLQMTDVVSDDGGTASQAIQQAVALFLLGCYMSDPAEQAARYEAAKDIAETLNEGRAFSAGVIDLSRPIIPYAPHASPAAGLLGVTPNPMANTSTLGFEVTTPGNTSVRIFDVSGRLVRTLLDRELPRGRHTAVWDGRGDGGGPVANGVYFYRIETPSGGPLTARFVVVH